VATGSPMWGGGIPATRSVQGWLSQSARKSNRLAVVTANRTRWADDPRLVSFYESHRCQPEELYPSERRFLPWLAVEAHSVLDVGCASGGFVDIWRHFGPDVLYRGVDVSAPLIESARRSHPDVEFLIGDCADGLPLSAHSSEVVQALGWLHWEPRYRVALEELWRLTARWLFFDVRLVEGDADLTTGKQRLAFTDPEDDAASTPYICVSWPGFAALLRDLEPARVLGYGYWGDPAETVSGVDGPVCFATFVLQRTPQVERSEQVSVALDMPLPWPEAWSEKFARLPADWLEENVSQDAR
jgi:SAM-dependent methyltransferase